MRRHRGKRNQPGRRGLRLVQDIRRIRHYTGKHRQEVTQNVVKGLTIGGVFAMLVMFMLELPYTSAVLVLLFVGMAWAGVALT